MSLVAYAASSDEDASDSDDEQPQAKAILLPKTSAAAAVVASKSSAADCISDDDDDAYSVQDLTLDDLKRPRQTFAALALPKPKNVVATPDVDAEQERDTVAPTFAKLPQPKAAVSGPNAVIEEADDEFLHKKAEPLEGVEVEKPPPPPPTKGPVKISIPSLKHFDDVDVDKAKAPRKTTAPSTAGKTGLLSLLPVAKSEQNFAAKPESSGAIATASAAKPPSSLKFIPDTVKNRRPAYNTEGVDGPRPAATKKQTAPPAAKSVKSARPLVECSDSDDEMISDTPSKGGDFFSLQTEDKLPEVHATEIAAMVAKRAAKMAETKSKYMDAIGASNADDTELAGGDDGEAAQAQRRAAEKRYAELDDVAFEALEGGGNRKRRRKQGAASNIQIVDIQGTEIMPDRDEWMRTALASSTTYQPTGVLNDEEPAAGTRRKHQITYLAHKAKANEAELQAMWSVNRQNRRATQSKYGF